MGQPYRGATYRWVKLVGGDHDRMVCETQQLLDDSAAAYKRMTRRVSPYGMAGHMDRNAEIEQLVSRALTCCTILESAA
jgi:hypothetical protein